MTALDDHDQSVSESPTTIRYHKVALQGLLR